MLTEAWDLRYVGRSEKDQVKPETPKQLLPTTFTTSHATDLLFALNVVCLILLAVYK